jgi:hypothetical protein
VTPYATVAGRLHERWRQRASANAASRYAQVNTWARTALDAALFAALPTLLLTCIVVGWYAVAAAAWRTSGGQSLAVTALPGLLALLACAKAAVATAAGAVLLHTAMLSLQKALPMWQLAREHADANIGSAAWWMHCILESSVEFRWVADKSGALDYTAPYCPGRRRRWVSAVLFTWLTWQLLTSAQVALEAPAAPALAGVLWPAVAQVVASATLYPTAIVVPGWRPWTYPRRTLIQMVRQRERWGGGWGRGVRHAARRQ